MPDLYARGDYDLAGFCVGVVERKRLIDGRAISPGDVVLGVASSGLHSNGYSLVRKVVFDIAGLERRRSRRRARHAPSARRCWSRRGSTSAPCASVLRLLQGQEASCTASPTSPAAGCTKIWSGFCPRASRAVIERGSWTVPPVFRLAAAAGRNRRRRNGPGVQHGHRPGAGRQPVLRREHPQPTGRLRPRKLADRPHRGRRARRGVGASSNGRLAKSCRSGCRRQCQRNGSRLSSARPFDGPAFSMASSTLLLGQHAVQARSAREALPAGKMANSGIAVAIERFEHAL